MPAQGDYSILSETRRANAFAAELSLLCEVIADLRPKSLELRSLAEHYGISHSAARMACLQCKSAG